MDQRRFGAMKGFSRGPGKMTATSVDGKNESKILIY
jgi:hypothetical protein